MKNVINTTGISTVDFIQGQKGTYRAIVKVQAGFLTVVDDLGIEANWGRQAWNSGYEVFRNFKKGALQTIQFRAEGGTCWLTVFAVKGKKVILADKEILAEITVGDINGNWYDTNLYSSLQYSIVGAKTWASQAFIMNEALEVA